MKTSTAVRIYRLLGMHAFAVRAEADDREHELMSIERGKPENKRFRKISYEEIMRDLATGEPGRFMDRKVQAYMSGDYWPPSTDNETFDKIRLKGVDNAWTTSVRGAEYLLQISYPESHGTVTIELGSYRATFRQNGTTYRVVGRSVAMAVMAVHFTLSRMQRGEATGPEVDILP